MQNLKIIPLGGVAEIGSNMTLFAVGKKAVLIDCGILFPYDNFFNIDYLIPDFSILDDYEIENIIFTHGHEDHIGAVAHIIKKIPGINIHATRFCAELINAKLDYLQIKAMVNVFDTNSVFKLEGYEIHPIHVNHSIPETTGMLFKGKDKTVLFISDFKVDLNNPYEKPIDIEKIIRLQEDTKLNLLMLDSTNILNPGKTLGEGDIIKDLDYQIGSFKKKVFVTLFSSNIHRLLSVFDLAQKHGRKIAVSGRSIHRYIEAGTNAGLIDSNKYTIWDEDQIDRNDDNYLIIISGCQGDFRSSLKRLAEGNHSKIKLNHGDAVIFSSKVIPGNEKQVYRIYNNIIELGAHVVTAKDSQIHASGHPGQEDLKYLLDHISFSDYIPIHGESYFLSKHIKFINQNYKKAKTHFVLNGNSIDISNSVKINKSKIDQPKIIHSKLLEIERSKISQRRKISESGLCVISISKNESLFQYSGLPEVLEEQIDKFESLISREAKKKSRDKNRGEEVRILARRNLQSILGYKPIVFVLDHD